MKAVPCLTWLLFIGTFVAQAGEVTIQSTDVHGNMTFNELTTATGYRVDWATNLLETAWKTSAPPGIAMIPATGAGTQSVTVDVQQARVFFRVVATLLPPSGMVLIPDGRFVMGNATNVFPASEGIAGETPQHTVYVSSFWMDQHEVTKALWDEVKTWADANGYFFNHSGSGKGTSYPVHTVDWYDAVKWCNARSEKEGLTPCYRTNGVTYWSGTNNNVECDWSANGYRLPTEAEWEKAARGGVADTRFPWTDYTNNISHAKANHYADSGLFGYDLSNGYHPSYSGGGPPYTSPVGSFAPNGYGLYDMAGNVWEWCWDWYSSTYYDTSPDADPTGPSSGTFRMLRGGGWSYNAALARLAKRDVNYLPSIAYNSGGFRCVRGP